MNKEMPVTISALISYNCGSKKVLVRKSDALSKKSLSFIFCIISLGVDTIRN